LAKEVIKKYFLQRTRACICRTQLIYIKRRGTRSNLSKSN